MTKNNFRQVASLLFLLVFTCLDATAQKDTVYSKASINGRYFKSYLTDSRDIITAPLSWEKKEWIIAGSVAGITGILVSQDAMIRAKFQSFRRPITDSITKYGLERFGSGEYSMPLVGSIYLFGVLTKNERCKKTGMLAVKAFVLSSAFVNIPKILINRRRPFQTESHNPYIFEGPVNIQKISGSEGRFFNKFYKSMPSGHTTAAFAVATVIAEEYKDKPIIPVISYTIASLTGLSRIHDDKHWASDVFFGAAFGWSIGKLVHNRNNWNVDIAPYRTAKTTGLSMVVPINR